MEKRGSQEDIVEGSDSSKHSRKASGSSAEIEKVTNSSGSRTPPNELETGGGSETPAASAGAGSGASAAGALAGRPKTSSLPRGPVVNITDESGKPKTFTESKTPRDLGSGSKLGQTEDVPLLVGEAVQGIVNHGSQPTGSKINHAGEYQQFCGYTVISMCHNELKFVEEFINNSSVLRNLISPLPYESYHMTTYNIYAHNRPPIKFVQDWLDGDKRRVISHNGCIPPRDVCSIMRKAQEVWDATCDGKFTIRPIGVKIFNGCVLILDVSMVDENLYEKFKQARLQCDQLFDKRDSNMPFHITLGYMFATTKYMHMTRDEIAGLNAEISQLGKLLPEELTMKPPAVCLFPSMKCFVPFRDFFEEGEMDKLMKCAEVKAKKDDDIKAKKDDDN